LIKQEGERKKVSPGIVPDYSSVLTILSLLAAGIIAEFFVFSHGQAAHDEKFFPNAIAICFMGLFYLLFGAVSFYIGKGKVIKETLKNPPSGGAQ